MVRTVQYASVLAMLVGCDTVAPQVLTVFTATGQPDSTDTFITGYDDVTAVSAGLDVQKIELEAEGTPEDIQGSDTTDQVKDAVYVDTQPLENDTSSSAVGLAFIPTGTFWMGCNTPADNCDGLNELPLHKVTLSAYYMDATETTVGQYKLCVDAGVCTLPYRVHPWEFATYPSSINSPVTFVSWAQSQQFCKWRGSGFDLPTEAQWEMAARGSCAKNNSPNTEGMCKTVMRTYPWGWTTPTCEYAVVSTCTPAAPWDVGSKPLGNSPYGLQDMGGNVWEWTLDNLGPYPAGPEVNTGVLDPTGAATGSYKVMRGGSFFTSGLYKNDARIAARPSATPAWDGSVGFRCAKAAQ